MGYGWARRLWPSSTSFISSNRCIFDLLLFGESRFFWKRQDKGNFDWPSGIPKSLTMLPIHLVFSSELNWILEKIEKLLKSCGKREWLLLLILKELRCKRKLERSSIWNAQHWLKRDSRMSLMKLFELSWFLLSRRRKRRSACCYKWLGEAEIKRNLWIPFF